MRSRGRRGAEGEDERLAEDGEEGEEGEVGTEDLGPEDDAGCFPSEGQTCFTSSRAPREMDRACESGRTFVSLVDANLWKQVEQQSVRRSIVLLQSLLEEGCELFERDDSGRTCAHWAACCGRGWELHFLLAFEQSCRRRCKESLSGQVSLLSMRDDGGRTILLSSVEFGHSHITRYLLTTWAEADPNDRDINGISALEIAIVKGDKNCVKYLLKAGANIQRVEGEISLSELAARCDDEQLVKLVSLAETSLPDLRSPSPGLLAYLRCQASFAIDRVITPKAYALADLYLPPPLRDRYIWNFSMTVFVFFCTVMVVRLYMSLILVGLFAIIWKWISSYFSQRVKQVEVAVGFWRGCVVSYMMLALLFTFHGYFANLCNTAGQVACRIFFHGACFIMLLACAATCASDPGIIEWDPTEFSFALQHVMEYGTQPSDYDAATMTRRPLRSKLCRESGGVCIARYDHFCIWINRPIGAGNHLLFLCFVAFQTLSILFFLLMIIPICFQHYDDILNPPFSGIALVAVFGMAAGGGLLVLLLQQLRGILMNITTNEEINKQRYTYFWRDDAGERRFVNPFDKGWYLNVKEFLGIGGRVEYVRLFQTSHPDRSRFRHGNDLDELEVLVVPSGWTTSEGSACRFLPPILPMSIHSE